MSKLKAVYIEWLDSVGWDGWAHEETKGDLEHRRISGVGFVEGETEEMLMLSNHISHETGRRYGLIKIPKVAIVKRRPIRLP